MLLTSALMPEKLSLLTLLKQIDRLFCSHIPDGFTW